MVSKRAGLGVLILVGILAAEGLGLGSPPAQPPKPDVDRVLRELQSLERQDMRYYGFMFWFWLDPEYVRPDWLYGEHIINGLTYLIIQQMGLEDYVTWYRYFDDWDDWPGIVTVEGEFGKKLWETLGFGPLDGGVLVEHVELRELSIGKSGYYTLTISGREIELELEDGFIGFEWGVGALVLSQCFPERRIPDGTPYVEEKELWIHQVESKLRPGTYISGAKFTRRLYRPNGVLVEVEQWDFIEGNPNSVRYGREVKGE